MATRSRNPRGEGEQLRRALLDAATELLGESPDVERMSVRAVTARAGVSPTALYLHFADKEELVDAVKTRCFDALGQQLEAAEAAHDGDPRTQLEAMGLAYLRFAREQPGQYAVLFQTHIQKPGVRAKDLGETQGPGMAVFGQLLTAVERCGPSADPFELSCLLWMALHGLATARRADRTFPFPGEERFVALLAAQALGSRGD
jgi:AcrR family transcriptional regulator